jgi:rhodanese-related sulfurtransferase
MKTRVLFLLISLTLPLTVHADNEAVIEAMQEFMEFAEYAEGAISPEQINSIGVDAFAVVDTRSQTQYEAGHIHGAIHIEWRQILARRDELPGDRPVVLYCDTGLLSSKAHFALRLAGHDNVKVLYGGYNGWKLDQMPMDSQ